MGYRLTVLCLLSTIVACIAASKWEIISHNVVGIGVGYGFRDQKVGYIGGDNNGQGPIILKSTDGGYNWTAIPGVDFKLDFLIVDTAAAGRTAMVTSPFGQMYSLDEGNTWKHSFPPLCMSQDVRAMDKTGLSYALAGEAGKISGIGVSHDGGITFKWHDANLTKPTVARYGAYPSKSTYYVAAGSFPAPPPPGPPAPPPAPEGEQTQKVVSLPDRKSMFRWMDKDLPRFPTMHLTGTQRRNVRDGNEYSAALLKTTDGGETFKTQFFQNHTFYFNGIDCAPGNENHCCVAGEAFADSSDPGARIYCTEDGGSNWTRNFFVLPSGDKYISIADLKFASATDVWACGSQISGIPKPMFYYSNNGGKTWANVPTEMIGGSCMTLDFVDGVGFAAILNTITQSSSLAKYGGGPAPPPPPPGPPAPPSPPSPTGGHYGDPNKAPCQSDEIAVRITGLQGAFCSPSCSASSPCPTDVPDGATCKPECVLEKQGSSTPTQCALICQPSVLPKEEVSFRKLKAPDAECPTLASCKKISNTGICTYDS